MSASGVVMMRVEKLVPALEKPPVVMPAPKTSWPGVLVVTVPLLADEPTPAADEPTSNGRTGSRPLYSRARRSTYGVGALNVTVRVLAPAAAALMFLA